MILVLPLRVSFPIWRSSDCFSKPGEIVFPTSPTLTSISKSFSSTVFISTIRSLLGVLSRGVPWLPWEPSRWSKLRRRSSMAGSMLLSFCRGLSRQRSYSPPIPLSSPSLTAGFPLSCLNLVFSGIPDPGVYLLGSPEQVIHSLWVQCLHRWMGMDYYLYE